MIKVNVFPIQEIRGVLANVIHSKTLNVEMNKSQILRCMTKGKVYVGDTLVTHENLDQLYEQATEVVEEVAATAVEEVKVEEVTPEVTPEPAVEETPAPVVEETKVEEAVTEPAVEETPAQEEAPVEETVEETPVADDGIAIVDESTVESKNKKKK